MAARPTAHIVVQARVLGKGIDSRERIYGKGYDLMTIDSIIPTPRSSLVTAKATSTKSYVSRIKTR